jgi:hypothetical protein
VTEHAKQEEQRMEIDPILTERIEHLAALADLTPEAIVRGILADWFAREDAMLAVYGPERPAMYHEFAYYPGEEPDAERQLFELTCGHIGEQRRKLRQSEERKQAALAEAERMQRKADELERAAEMDRVQKKIDAGEIRFEPRAATGGGTRDQQP